MLVAFVVLLVAVACGGSDDGAVADSPPAAELEVSPESAPDPEPVPFAEEPEPAPEPESEPPPAAELEVSPESAPDPEPVPFAEEPEPAPEPESEPVLGAQARFSDEEVLEMFDGAVRGECEAGGGTDKECDCTLQVTRELIPGDEIIAAFHLGEINTVEDARALFLRSRVTGEELLDRAATCMLRD